MFSMNGINERVYTEFEFHNKLLFSQIYYPISTIAFYIIFIPFLQNFMKTRKAPPLKWILFIHNIFLSVVSTFMAMFLFLTILEFSTEKKYDYWHIYCKLNEFDQKGTLTFIYYCNYILKYYEVKLHFHYFNNKSIKYFIHFFVAVN